MMRNPRSARVGFWFKLGALALTGVSPVVVDVTSQPILNSVVDMSRDFRDFADSYFITDHVTAFDPATGVEKLRGRQMKCPWGLSFNNTSATYEKVPGNE